MQILIIIFIALFIYSAISRKNQRLEDPYEKGWQTESVTYQTLRSFENAGGKFLFNLLIPNGQGNTTEIDVLLISSKGLFVFECKNYSGWIFGNEAHKNWTQTLPQGHGRCQKVQFYNPIKQNALHIRCLKMLLGKNVPMRSIIVFSDRGVLKDITVHSVDVSVVNLNDLEYEINELCRQLPDSYSREQISKIYEKLYMYTQVEDVEIENHVESLRRRLRCY